MSSRVVKILRQFTPNLEAYSIDENFLQIESVLQHYADTTSLGQTMRQAVKQFVGLPVCVGIGSTKTLAKCASKGSPQML